MSNAASGGTFGYADLLHVHLCFAGLETYLCCLRRKGMSLKVYDGMRSKGVDAGYLVGSRVRRAMLAKQEEFFGMACVQYATELLDGREFGWFTGEIGSWWDIVRECRARWQAVYSTGQRDPAMDFGFQAFFNLSGDWTLAFFSCEHGGLMDVWSELSGFEAYPAWDNVDAPDDVPEEEWSERCDEWRSALDGVALTLSFTEAPCPSFSPEFVPFDRKRAESAARNLYREENCVFAEDGKMSDAMRELQRVREEYEALGDKEERILACMSRLPDIAAFFGRKQPLLP